MNPNFKLFSIKGHSSAYQYATGHENDFNNASGVPMIDVADDLELSDIEIDDVSKEKKQTPILTKKGKLIVGALIVGWGLWYIWKRYQASKAQPSQISSNPQSQEGNQEGNSNSAVDTEKANNTMSSLTNEDGVVGE